MSVKSFIAQNDSSATTTTLPVLTKVYHSSQLNKKNFKGFDVIHNRLLTSAIKNFQEEIKGIINRQIEINFDFVDSTKLKFPIFLDEIVKGRQHYKDIIKSAKDLEEVKVMRYEKIDGKEYSTEVRIFSQVWQPTKINKKSAIYVAVDKELFKSIADVYYANAISPSYIGYYYEVVMQSRNKYLPKLYWVLSQFSTSDKNKKGGLYRISHLKLLEIMGIDSAKNQSYLDVGQFNRRILKPIQKELYETCKFYFSYSFEKYKAKDKEHEYYYTFTIINRDEMIKIENKFLVLEKYLLELFPDDANEILTYINEEHIKNNPSIIDEVTEIVMDMKYQNKAKDIKSPKEYFQGIIAKKAKAN